MEQDPPSCESPQAGFFLPAKQTGHATAYNCVERESIPRVVLGPARRQEANHGTHAANQELHRRASQGRLPRLEHVSGREQKERRCRGDGRDMAVLDDRPSHGTKGPQPGHRGSVSCGLPGASSLRVLRGGREVVLLQEQGVLHRAAK